MSELEGMATRHLGMSGDEVFNSGMATEMLRGLATCHRVGDGCGDARSGDGQ